MRDLIPVHYFHVVFTVPGCLQPLFVRDRRQSYALLFSVVWETLSGSVVGGWEQHRGDRCPAHVVPDPSCFTHTSIASLPEAESTRAVSTGSAAVPTSSSQCVCCLASSAASCCKHSSARHRTALATPSCARRLFAAVGVVYSKPPMVGPQQVLRYLGRYTHRIAISNERIVSISEGRVELFAIGIAAVETGPASSPSPARSWLSITYYTSCPSASSACVTMVSSPIVSGPTGSSMSVSGSARQPWRSHSSFLPIFGRSSIVESPGVSRIAVRPAPPGTLGLWPPLPALALRSRAADHEHDPPPIACRPNDKRQDLSANACFHLAPLCPPTACASPSGALSISSSAASAPAARPMPRRSAAQA